MLIFANYLKTAQLISIRIWYSDKYKKEDENFLRVLTGGAKNKILGLTGHLLRTSVLILTVKRVSYSLRSVYRGPILK